MEIMLLFTWLSQTKSPLFNWEHFLAAALICDERCSFDPSAFLLHFWKCFEVNWSCDPHTSWLGTSQCEKVFLAFCINLKKPQENVKTFWLSSRFIIILVFVSSVFNAVFRFFLNSTGIRTAATVNVPSLVGLWILILKSRKLFNC